MSTITVLSNPSTTSTKEDAITNAINQWLYGKSNRYKRNYTRVIRSYISYLGDIHIANSTAAHFRDYQEYLYQSGKTINTINTYTNIIKSFFTFLRDESVLPVRTASKRIGISASPHWLRHTHASLALQNGADINQVSTSLGHSSVATTTKYLHARPNDCTSLYL
ncbi:site-specific integrase [Cylindrospermopsis raciborskii]|uniref:site-specific integrase n=1 Tax=Cylindrospermopsis raciborskii TaxID=77022 RepID=UPI00215B02C0|nr:site-specific integrase [Cylindrospermopsis raciborskii]